MVCILLYIQDRFVNRGFALQGTPALLAVTAVAVLIAACGDKSDVADSQAGAVSILTAATLGEQSVRSVDEYLAAAPYANADTANGERQAQVCRACHSLDADARNMIGPALSGFFGVAAGTRAGFEYSPVLRDSGFVWTPRALDAWLAYPGRFLPGNRMTFPGVPGQQDRDDLIAYLMQATVDGSAN